MKKKINDFKPAWWLNSGHLQTIFPFIFPRKINLKPIRKRLELPDSDFLDLDYIGESKKGIVLILPGLAGSMSSHYVQGMMNALVHHNYAGVLLNFRGCSGEPNRLARCYHSGDTQDLEFVVNFIKTRYPSVRLSIVGYSLGGNILLKWLGECGKSEIINTAVAVSVPFDLSNTVKRLQIGFSKLYQLRLLNQLKRQILQKEKIIAPLVNCSSLNKIKNFEQFDETITAPLHGFKGANEYYQSSSCRRYLKDINVSTLIINALDDPFMTPDCIPRSEELSKTIAFELYRSGGHVGFISGSSFHKPSFWLESRILDYIDSPEQTHSRK